MEEERCVWCSLGVVNDKEGSEGESLICGYFGFFSFTPCWYFDLIIRPNKPLHLDDQAGARLELGRQAVAHLLVCKRFESNRSVPQTRQCNPGSQIRTSTRKSSPRFCSAERAVEKATMEGVSSSSSRILSCACASTCVFVYRVVGWRRISVKLTP